ncbi:MAG TPA: hypothetical protein VFR41_05005 [Acidimicrobiia bacterium]|nr:hypothetical protein [Acidimicrobiia bacterium]
MKKLLIVATVLVGIGVLAKRFAPKVENIDWQQCFEAMPDNAPPKWMFHNISEIHDNTERILDLLESRVPRPEDSSMSTAAPGPA